MPLNGEYEPSKAQFVRDQVELYESSGGTQRTTSSVLVTRREDERLRNLPVVILSTLGAKSGKIRKTPLMRVEHDGFYAVVASMAGAPRTLHGVTKPVTLTAEIGGFGDGLTPGSKVIGVSATTEISRAAFEAGPAIPTAVVSDKIKIELDIEAVLQA